MTGLQAASTLGTFRALGFSFEVECAFQPLNHWLGRTLAPLEDSHGAAEHTYCIERAGEGWRLLFDGTPWRRPLPPERVLPALITDVNRRTAESTSEHLVLHAGVIRAGDGSATLLVGPSGSGKSTLVATAVQRGWAYGGDEHAAVRYRSATVDPVAKPIALKAGSRERFESRARADPVLAPFFDYQLLLSPEDLGGTVMGPSPIGAVVLPEFRLGAPTKIVDAGGAAAVVTLRSETFNWTRDASAGFDTLVLLSQTLPVLQLRFGDASSALAALLATESEISASGP